MSTGFVIEGELTVFAVHELKDRLLAALACMTPGQSLSLDLSGVGEVDGAGIQLLLAFRREALQRGIGLRLEAPAAAVTSALALIDLLPLFIIDAHGTAQEATA